MNNFTTAGIKILTNHLFRGLFEILAAQQKILNDGPKECIK